MTFNIAGLALVILLSGCASKGQHAPVVEHGTSIKTVKPLVKSNDSDWRPRVHVVQKGDTLYAIAFNYGLDPRELAEQNNIQDPNLIYVGQQISLFAVVANARTVQPVTLAKPVLKLKSQPKDQPRVVKYPYTDTAVAKVEAVQSAVAQVDRKTPLEVKPDVKPEARVEAKAEVKTESVAEGDDALEWSMPTQGKLLSGFSEAANRKGIDIEGRLGQPVFASAPGKVVYSGSGLRGYGKLLIIKHNNTYLSAYAHNDQLLVKEGESVARGQKIAEMGNTDSDQVLLHFEVRRFGKPVDPANYLALNKS